MHTLKAAYISSSMMNSLSSMMHSLKAMKHSLKVVVVCSMCVLITVSVSRVEAWTCESSCGGIQLNEPFGSGGTCGSSSFQPYVNCSNGKLQFYTPTGTYKVQSIDYTNNVMVVQDAHMSTCSTMQGSGAFGLPIGAPFSFASYNKVVLIGCSSTSSLYSKQSCDTSNEAAEICQSIYGNCAGISEIGIVAENSNVNNYNGGGTSSSSCCVYSSSLLGTAPYEIDLPLLQCTTYTSVYQIGSLQSPQSTWLFGIALQFNPNASPSSSSSSSSSNGGQNPTCYVCQEAEESHGSIRAAPWIAGLIIMVAAMVSFTIV